MFGIKKISQIRNSELAHNSATLLSANVVAQVIGLIIYPVLTRLYSPDDFGLLNLFLSIGGVLVILANSEIHFSVVLPKEEKRAVACFHNGLSMLVGVSLLCVAFIPFSRPIASLFNTPQLANWIFLLPAFVFSQAIWTLLNYWYTRNKQYRDISIYQLTQSSLSAGAKCGLGWAGFLSGGMIVSMVFAPLASVLISIKTTFKKHLRPLLKVDKEECRLAAREYVNFPKYDMPRAVINNFSCNLPFFLLTPYFGLTEMGFLGMAFTLAVRPINVVANSFNQVLFQKTAESVHNKSNISHLFSRFVSFTLMAVVPTFAILYFVLPSLTEWLLGEGWSVAGGYIRIMLPWVAMNCIASSINFIPDVFKRQRGLLMFETAYFIVRALSLLIGIYLNSFITAIALYSLSNTVMLIIECVWFRTIIANYEEENQCATVNS